MLSPVTLDYALRLRHDAESGAACVYAVLPAWTHQQQLATESLHVSGAASQAVVVDPASATRYLQVVARGGPIEIAVESRVRLLQAEHDPPSVHRPGAAYPFASIEAMHALRPSRHCPSDRLAALAGREFLVLDAGFERAAAIDRWVRRHVRVAGAPIDAAQGWRDAHVHSRDALELLDRGVGTSWDCVHLAIALCRASGLPARCATGADLSAAATDGLHPWLEVLVDDTWLVFDPAGPGPRTALLRIGTGRDAADVPALTAYGRVGPTRLDASVRCVDASLSDLQARDASAKAISAARLGSLADASRWHREVGLATGAQTADVGPTRAPPSQRAAAAARAAASLPRAGVTPPLFVRPAAATGATRASGRSGPSRSEPV